MSVADEPLVAAYEGVVCDLDGVVYRGSEAIPYAVSALTEAARHRPLCFATNNASRTPAEVAAQLRELGLTVDDAAVVTSAQAGAALLASELPSGAAVLTVGGPGVAAAVLAAGLTTTSDPDQARAVLQGWGREVRVDDLARASIAVARGARWVATNTDRTLPTAHGLVPGNGTLVAAVAEATGATPEVVGKPHPPLYRVAAERLGAAANGLLAVGDRLDTDIVGASAVGADSLWVLTGVDGFTHLARSTARPTYAACDLRALLAPRPDVVRNGRTWTWAGTGLTLEAGGPRGLADGIPMDLGDIHANRLVAVGLAAVLGLRDDGEVGKRGAAVLAEALDGVLMHCRPDAPAQ